MSFTVLPLFVLVRRVVIVSSLERRKLDVLLRVRLRLQEPRECLAYPAKSYNFFFLGNLLVGYVHLVENCSVD
jgi:hypothetical protein